MQLGSVPWKSLILGIMTTIGAILFLAGRPNSMTTVDEPARSSIETPLKQIAVNDSYAPNIESKSSGSVAIEDTKVIEDTKAVDDKNEEADAAFRLRNVEKIMALPITRLTDVEKDLAIGQILSELPYLVRKGRMHPFDAVFAHVKALERQDVKLEEEDVKNIKAKYVGLYPYSIEIDNRELE